MQDEMRGRIFSAGEDPFSTAWQLDSFNKLLKSRSWLIGRKCASGQTRDADMEDHPKSSLVGLHVENRRLFDLAVGRLRLEKWEKDHVHTCQVCQGVLYLFVNLSTADPPKSGRPAA